jgi:hypothetical protein
MKVDIQKAVDFILDDSKDRYLRAIKLFEFLVALHLGKPRLKITDKKTPPPPDETNLTLDVSDEDLRAARMLAGLKMLNQLEDDWEAANPNKKATLRRMIEVKSYSEIHNKIILKNGSWYRIRHLPSIRSFEDQLWRPRWEARRVARIIEFSCRFVFNPAKRKQLGGVTMAIDIVTTMKYFKPRVKKSTLEKYWSWHQSAAPFFYLIYVRKFPFHLAGIVHAKFAKRYLSKINNRSVLIEFFQSYNAVVEQLRPRGYRYTPLKLPASPITATVQFEQFSNSKHEEREVLDEIAAYGR